MSKKHTKAKKHQARLRCERLARQIVIHGKRFAGDDDDFLGGIRKPAAMTEHDKITVYNWMTSTPQRWHVTATVYFQPPGQDAYHEIVEGVTGQNWLINDLKDWILSLLDDAGSNGNHNHKTAESLQYRLARQEDYRK